MIVKCEPMYPGDDRLGHGHCGKEYDDAECSTICPHDPLPPKRSLEELEAIAKEQGVELPRFGDAAGA